MASFVTVMAKNPKTFHDYVVYNLILAFLRPVVSCGINLYLTTSRNLCVMNNKR